MSEALTEICKMDPDFSKEEFLKKCEYDILKDWCHEGPFNILSTPIKHALSLGNNYTE
jgi:import inner membrane translocase subunit TIM44